MEVFFKVPGQKSKKSEPITWKLLEFPKFWYLKLENRFTTLGYITSKPQKNIIPETYGLFSKGGRRGDAARSVYMNILVLTFYI